ncbi:hypothetical protein GC174_16480 [bacterium]|nr:hypothetical protein [bacterium]
MATDNPNPVKAPAGADNTTPAKAEASQFDVAERGATASIVEEVHGPQEKSETGDKLDESPQGVENRAVEAEREEVAAENPEVAQARIAEMREEHGKDHDSAGMPGEKDRRLIAEAKSLGIQTMDRADGDQLNRLHEKSPDGRGPVDPTRDVETPGKLDEAERSREVTEGERVGEPTNLEDATRRLRELTDGKMGVNQASFDANLEKFLNDPNRSEKDKLDTINTFSRTIEAGDKSAREGIGVEGGIKHDYLGTGQELSDNVRTIIAGGMDNAANPKSIDQGDSRQCNATTVQEQLFGQNPALAAAKLNEVVTNATFTGERTFDASGNVIKGGGEFTAKVPPGIFKQAIAEVGNVDQAGNEVHSAATRLMNGGIINQTKQQQGQWYTENPSTGPGDSGERLYHMTADGGYSKENVRDQNGNIVKGPGADIVDVAAMAKGAGVKDIAIMTSRDYLSRGGPLPDNLHIVSSAADIDRAMEGKVGGILGGNSGDKYFTGRSDTNGGGHVVSIYKGQDGKYEVSDQYGHQRDRTGISSEVLANITKGYDARARGDVPQARPEEEYGRRTDGGSTRPGYNPATDRSEADYSGGRRYQNQPGEAVYYDQDNPGIRDANQKLQENPEKKPEELENKEKEKDGKTGNEARKAQIQGQIDALQAGLNKTGNEINEALDSNIYSQIAALRGQMADLV